MPPTSREDGSGGFKPAPGASQPQAGKLLLQPRLRSVPPKRLTPLRPKRSLPHPPVARQRPSPSPPSRPDPRTPATTPAKQPAVIPVSSFCPLRRLPRRSGRRNVTSGRCGCRSRRSQTPRLYRRYSARAAGQALSCPDRPFPPKRMPTRCASVSRPTATTTPSSNNRRLHLLWQRVSDGLPDSSHQLFACRMVGRLNHRQQLNPRQPGRDRVAPLTHHRLRT